MATRAVFALLTCGLLGFCWHLRADDAPVRQSQLAAEDRIREALNQPVKWEFRSATLHDALDSVRRDHGINIYIDRKALADAGVDLQSPVDLQLHDIPLKQALSHLLREPDLAWLVEDEVLYVTTRDVAETKLVTQVYPAADLMAVRNQFGEVDELFEDIATAEDLTYGIESSIHADDWEANGGAGNICALHGTLVVTQSREVHEDVAALLAALRQVRRQQFAADAAARYLPVRVEEGEVSAGERRILDALAEKVSWSCDKTPLDELAASLAAKHDILVLLDRKSLGDEGFSFKLPLTMTVEDVTLASGLQLLLPEFDLAFYVADGALWLTTRRAAEDHAVTRVYPVRDLVVNPRTGKCDFEPLITTIHNSVAPELWEVNGGASDMCPLAGSHCLIVDTTSEVHGDLLDLLTGLRAIPSYKEPPLTAEAAGLGDDDLRLRSYVLDYFYGSTEALPMPKVDQTPEESREWLDMWTALKTRQNQELASLLKEIVEPDAWNQEDVFIKALPDRIVVQHNGRMHKLVREVLVDLGVYSPDIELNDPYGDWGPPSNPGPFFE